MRKPLTVILLCILTLQLLAETPYQEFRATKGMVERSSFVNIFRQKDKLLLEIPDSLVGRRVLVSSYIRSTSDPSIPVGKDISAGQAFRIGRTDSLLLFLQPAPPFLAADSSIVESMRNARADAIAIALPIKYRNGDGTAFVVEADKLLDPADKKIADLKGLAYGDYSVSTSTYKKELSATKDVTACPGSVGVLRTLTYDLKLRGLFGEMPGSYKFSGDVETCLTLLPESTLAPLKADDRIGARTVSYPSIDPDSQGYRNRSWVSRWNLSGGRKIEVYVDTLLAAPWYAAVRDGMLEWNRAFRQAGLGDIVAVQPFPAEGFNACNPLVNTVIQGSGKSLGANISTDPQTGEIISFCISVPDDFVASARREGMVYISDVDARYRSYDLPQDAVAEVLKAQTMTVFGQCLGLLRNFAGSYAYSPEQLRDAAFTREHGITASVTDAVIFNLLAQPGDKEKGVATVVSRLGAYDEYAIRLIYDDTLDRDAWLSGHYGQPEYLYLPNVRGNSDPRGLSGDLGNDPFETYRTVIARLQWVAANAAEWIDSDDVSQEYKDLFADYVFLGVDRVVATLAAQVGGLMTDNRSTPKYRAVPARKQEEALSLILNSWKHFYWMDDKSELLHLAGANRDVSVASRLFGWTQSRLASRYDVLAMSSQLVTDAYPLESALQDIEDLLLKDLRSGKDIVPGEDMMIAQYAASLFGRSPVMKAQEKDASNRGISLRVTAVPTEYTQETEAVCYNALLHLRKSLKSVRGGQKKEGKAKLDYILSLIDNALNHN